MPVFSADQLAFLHRYGFDEQLFESWRKSLRSGQLSRDNNVVTGELRAPGSGVIKELPKRGSAEHDRLTELGKQAIWRGEVGMVILNGGMATRFGGVVKGIVEVLPGRSFLALRCEDIARIQIECGGRVPLFLMNSFATEAATHEHFSTHQQFGLPGEQIHHFNQFAAARLKPNGDLFLEDGKLSPFSTGHGDFAPALRHSGALGKFLQGGGKTLFVANVDNLGARLDPLMVGVHLASQLPATVEVAPKWPGDVGGSPYLFEGKVQLIEQIRYPKGFDADMVDVFNTNTFHFDARALDRDFDLGWYYVEKKVGGQPAVQVERLIGELTRALDSQYVRVKRTGSENRFLPVKTPDDLTAARDEIAALYPS